MSETAPAWLAPFDPVEAEAHLAAADPRLRLAGPDDAEALQALVLELASLEFSTVPARLAANLRAFFAAPGAAFVLLATHRSAPAGFVLVQRMPLPIDGGVQLWVDDLFVRPAARRRGLGAALLLGVQALGRLCDARYIYLHVRRDNAPARALYRQIGMDEAPDLICEWSLDG